MKPMTGSAIVVGILTAFVTACGGGGASATAGDDGGDRELSWAREVVWEAGGFEATDWDVFGSVAGVGFDGDGNLHILDRQAFKVTVVGPDGEPIRTYGAQGEGPGELNSPMSIVVFRDGSSAVQDLNKFGLVTYDPYGEWAGDVSWRSEGMMILLTDMAPAGGRTLFAERSTMMRLGGSSGADGEEEPPGDPVVRVDLATGDLPEVLFRAWEPPEVEGRSEQVTLATSSGGFTANLRPIRAFTPGMDVAGLSGGRVAVVDSTTYAIRVLDASGTVQHVVSRPIEPIEVTEAIQNAERDRRMRDLLEDEGGAPGPFGDDNEAQIRRIEQMSFWPEIPIVDALAADWDDRLWVTRGVEPGEEPPIDILTIDGDYVGTLPGGAIEVPSAFGPNGLAAWIERDEFDAQRVVVGRIVETNSPAG